MTHSEKQQLWQDRLQQQKESGLTVTAWCEQHQIAQSQFYYWRKKAEPSAGVQDDRVLVPMSISPMPTGLVIETPSGYRLSVNDVSSVPLLPDILKLLP